MKISDLVFELNVIHQEYGDLEVVYYDGFSYYFTRNTKPAIVNLRPENDYLLLEVNSGENYVVVSP